MVVTASAVLPALLMMTVRGEEPSGRGLLVKLAPFPYTMLSLGPGGSRAGLEELQGCLQVGQLGETRNQFCPHEEWTACLHAKVHLSCGLILSWHITQKLSSGASLSSPEVTASCAGPGELSRGEPLKGVRDGIVSSSSLPGVSRVFVALDELVRGSWVPCGCSSSDGPPGTSSSVFTCLPASLSSACLLALQPQMSHSFSVAKGQPFAFQ